MRANSHGWSGGSAPEVHELIELPLVPKAAPSRVAGVSFLGDARFVTLLDQGLVSGTAFASAVVVGRVCSQAEFGFYMLGLTVLFLLTEAQGSLVSTPFMLRAPRLSPGARSRSAGTSLLLQLSLAAGATVLLALGALLLGIGDSEGLPVVLGALAIAAPPILLREHLRRLSLASFDFRGLLRTDAFACTLQLASLALLLVAQAVTPARAFLAMAVGAAGGCLFWSRDPPFEIAVHVRRIGARFGRYWLLGRWVFASGIAWALALHLFPWLLAGIRGPAAAGIWAACFGVANIANPLLLALSNWVGPATAHSLAREGLTDLRRTTVQASRAVSLLFAPVVAASFLWGDQVVELIYGARFAGHGAVVGWLMVHVAVTAVGVPASRALFALGRAEADFRANAVQLACAAVLGAVLVWRGGPEGGAMGLALTSAVATLLRIRSFRQADGRR